MAGPGPCYFSLDPPLNMDDPFATRYIRNITLHSSLNPGGQYLTEHFTEIALLSLNLNACTLNVSFPLLSTIGSDRISFPASLDRQLKIKTIGQFSKCNCVAVYIIGYILHTYILSHIYAHIYIHVLVYGCVRMYVCMYRCMYRCITIK